MKHNNILLAVCVALTTAACTATSSSNSSTGEVLKAAPNQFAKVVKSQPANTAAIETGITLEQIMAHPDWMGREPQSAYWGDDSQHIFYSRKQQGTELSDLFVKSLGESGNGSMVSLADMHLQKYESRSLSSDKKKAAWSFKGNIFVKDLTTNKVTQITHSSDPELHPEFINDGRLVYRRSNQFFAVDLATMATKEIANLKLQKKPQPVKAPKDYIAEEQLKLIKYVAKRRQDKVDRNNHSEKLQAANDSLTAKPFYLGKGKTIVMASLSPAGDKMIVAIRDDIASRQDSDIMPNYIGDDSRIKSENVRRRVADAKPVSHELVLLNLTTGEQRELGYQSLPGYNEDVLAEVKKENAARKGEEYQVNRIPRAIHLIADWYWSQSAVQWNKAGSQAAVMLEAWDNKDRWLASVDFAKNKLVSQHRLHDDAWINYKFNSFGWLNNSDDLYYLSEESGYSQLYRKPVNGKAKALTQGQYVVDELTLTHDDQFIYYQANKKHPGIYEIYRLNLASGESKAVTDLNGMTDYELSPDESKLLITHSKTTQPDELYLLDMAAGDEVKRLTHTVSDKFANYKWNAPTIIQVKSSYQEQPVYARIYYPKDYDPSGTKYRAVVFNHGAGYLQNAHLGFSGYFREFMFHTLLAEKGYVVLDMDYRASQGYGRDWRTAIYRQMGTPEVEDLKDGVNWLVDNANVDRARIGTYGGSYGGFLTFMSMFNAPELFAAGAALRPVTDWAHYNTGYTANILNTPADDPIAFERSSPIYFAEGLQKPLLINAPMVDNNVFFVDVVRLVQRFIELEKQDFETAIYPVEPHGFRQPSSWLDEYRRIFKLFEENL